MHFFAVVLHDGNVRLPETSELHVLLRKFYMWSCSRFSLPLIFNLVAASILIFSCTAAIKFSCYSSNEIGLLCFLSLALALYLLYTTIKTLKLIRKKESALLLLFFISKSPGGYMMYRRTRGYLKCKISPLLT